MQPPPGCEGWQVSSSSPSFSFSPPPHPPLPPSTFSSSSIRLMSNSKSTICPGTASPRSIQVARRLAVSKSSGMDATAKAKLPLRASTFTDSPLTWTTSPLSVRGPYRWSIDPNARRCPVPRNGQRRAVKRLQNFPSSSPF